MWLPQAIGFSQRPRVDVIVSDTIRKKAAAFDLIACSTNIGRGEMSVDPKFLWTQSVEGVFGRPNIVAVGLK